MSRSLSQEYPEDLRGALSICTEPEPAFLAEAFRSSFYLYSQQMFNPTRGLLAPSLTENEAVFPLAEERNQASLDKYKVAGRFLGLALRSVQTIPVLLSKAIYAGSFLNPSGLMQSSTSNPNWLASLIISARIESSKPMGSLSRPDPNFLAEASLN